MPISSTSNCSSLENSTHANQFIGEQFEALVSMDQQEESSSSNHHNEVLEVDNNLFDGVDQLDSGIASSDDFREPRARATAAVSDSTQTDEFDTVDAAGGRYGIVDGQSLFNNGSSSRTKNGGLLSNLMTLVLPLKRKRESIDQEDGLNGFEYPNGISKRCTATQTEESPAAVRARELCSMVIQELVLERPAGGYTRDEVFESLCCCILEILEKHSILFNGMLRRFEVTDYRVFSSIADEVFEASTDQSHYKVTWGRVVSLFAFAVRLAQKYKESNDPEMIDNIMHYLSNYISKHILDFVDEDGGWEGLVKHFPLPDAETRQVKRAMLFSGLCVGLVATMYVSSFLSK